MIQKIIKVGNSAALTIPQSFLKEVGWNIGDEVIVDADKTDKIVFVKATDSTYNTKITPEFKQWLDDISVKYEDTIKELAKR